MIASDGDQGPSPQRRDFFRAFWRHYVREQGSLTLMDALRKIDAHAGAVFWTAPRLRGGLEGGDCRKGAEGGHHGVFDAKTIADRSTYQHPMEAERWACNIWWWAGRC